MKDMRADRDARKLRELLRGAVPDGPEPAGRADEADEADEVARRKRRPARRRGTVSAAAVALVALSVIVGPHLLPGSPVSNGATPNDTAAAAAHLAHPFTCPLSGHPAAPAMRVPGGKVAPGAVLARICRRGGETWSAPTDALVTNVDSVVTAFNSAPPAREMRCPASARVYSLTFQYGDGRLARINGMVGGCDYAVLFGTAGPGRSAGTQVMRAYYTALHDQRSTATPAPTRRLSR